MFAFEGNYHHDCRVDESHHDYRVDESNHGYRVDESHHDYRVDEGRHPVPKRLFFIVFFIKSL